MFSFGWSEIALTVIIIVIVVGPKEIPNLLKQIGSFSKSIKKISREFKKSLNDKGIFIKSLTRDGVVEETPQATTRGPPGNSHATGDDGRSGVDPPRRQCRPPTRSVATHQEPGWR